MLFINLFSKAVILWASFFIWSVVDFGIHLLKSKWCVQFVLLISGGATEGHVGEWRIRGTQSGLWQTQASDWNSDVMWSGWRTYKPDHVFPTIGSLRRSEEQFIHLMLNRMLWQAFIAAHILILYFNVSIIKGLLSCICNCLNTKQFPQHDWISPKKHLLC